MQKQFKKRKDYNTEKIQKNFFIKGWNNLLVEI